MSILASVLCENPNRNEYSKQISSITARSIPILGNHGWMKSSSYAKKKLEIFFTKWQPASDPRYLSLCSEGLFDSITTS